MARWLITAGIILLVLGVIVHVIPWTYSWFGKLPGDINIERENSRVFIPFTSMVVVSILLSILLSLFNR